MLLWCVGLMKATKEQGQALLLVDVGLTTMTQQQWKNDDSKQNEDLCVLENVKGTMLTPNIRGALFWCFHATLSSQMMVILLFHCAASESEGERDSATWNIVSEGVPLWLSFGEWGRLFDSHLQPAWICVNEGDGWCSSHTQSMMMLHPGCSPCWSCQEYAVHDGAAVQEYVVHDGAAVLDAML